MGIDRAGGAIHRAHDAAKKVSTTAVSRVLCINKTFLHTGAMLYEKYQQGSLLFGELVSRSTNGRGLSEETTKLVRDFYMRDSVTRQSPNSKDVLKVRITPKGPKVEATRRWLETDFASIHKMFQAEVSIPTPLSCASASARTPACVRSWARSTRLDFARFTFTLSRSLWLNS